MCRWSSFDPPAVHGRSRFWLAILAANRNNR
jgi:hypothetical protein